MQNKKMTEVEKQVTLAKAQCAISEYLRCEIHYSALMEEAALAQSQIIAIMNKMSYLPEDQQPLTDDITSFLYNVMNALKLLRPFAEIDGTL